MSVDIPEYGYTVFIVLNCHNLESILRFGGEVQRVILQDDIPFGGKLPDTLSREPSLKVTLDSLDQVLALAHSEVFAEQSDVKRIILTTLISRTHHTAQTATSKTAMGEVVGYDRDFMLAWAVTQGEDLVNAFIGLPDFLMKLLRSSR